MKAIFKSVNKKLLFIILICAAVYLAIVFGVCTYFVQKNSENYCWQKARDVDDYLEFYIENELAEENIPSITDLRDSENFSSLQELGEMCSYFCESMDIHQINIIIHTDDGRSYCLLSAKENEAKYLDNTTPHEGYMDYKSLNGKFTDKSQIESFGTIKLSDIKLNAYFIKVFNEINKDELDYIVNINIDNNDMEHQVRNQLLLVMGSLSLVFLFISSLLNALFRKVFADRIVNISTQMRDFVKDGNLNDVYIDEKGQDEIALMAQSFNSMARDIHEYINKTELYERTKQKADMESSVAAHIQMGLLPKNEYTDNQVKIYGYMKPAKTVGGDFYVYEKLNNGKIAFAIGDVSGKGIAASLLMSSIITALKLSFRSYESPSRILKDINNLIYSNNQLQMFATIFIGVYSPMENSLVYANAGHNPPYIIGDNLSTLSDGSGLLIGVFDDAEYEDITIDVKPGSEIFLYTDGVNEAISPDRGFFGLNRLEAALLEKSENRRDYVLEKLQEFTKDAEQSDDVTILTVEFINSFEKVLPAKKESLGELKSYVMNDDRIPSNLKRKIYLAMEEIFINICKYGYDEGKSGEVRVSIGAEDSEIAIVLSDDAKEFNPLEDMPDIDKYDINTQIGGLGRVLACNIMDEVNYSYIDSRNVLSMIKKIP